MTPKEKAEELYRKYYNNYGYYGIPREAIKHSKQCALIAVDEIINIWEYSDTEEKWWWQQVKQEIEKNYDPARKSN
jgi:hypothetical protein